MGISDYQLGAFCLRKLPSPLFSAALPCVCAVLRKKEFSKIRHLPQNLEAKQPILFGHLQIGFVSPWVIKTAIFGTGNGETVHAAAAAISAT
jgi:hypothetical protein